MPVVRRRSLLCALGALSVAGCASPGGGSGPDGGGSGPDNGDTVTGDLDLREANVVGVAFRTDDGEYEFDVTLHHDDDGEDGYADWWQVERLDGTRLARRDLAHPHSSEPFTRSTAVPVPEDVHCVVVRGHDQTHGYGGIAMIVDLDVGRIGEVRQGTEKSALSESDCP